MPSRANGRLQALQIAACDPFGNPLVKRVKSRLAI
jgi:hypothetical protein